MNLAIADVIGKYVDNPSGLLLFSSPTGNGKSYETAHLVAELVKKSNRKIYYLTRNNDNVNEFYSDVIEAMDNDLYRDKVIKIPSNRNAVLDGKNSIENQVTRDWPEARNLKCKIDEYEKLEDRELKAYKAEEMFSKSENFESKFRNRLKSEFKNDYERNGEYDQSPYQYMITSKWDFIKEIYPASTDEKRTVFIMTTSKFFRRNDPVISSAYRFTDDDNLKDALIFIDEIDVLKDELLDMLTEKRDSIDYIDLFHEIVKVLNNLDKIDRNTLDIANSKGLTCESRLIELKNKSDDIMEKYFPKTLRVKMLVRSDDGKSLQRLENQEHMLSYKGVHVHSKSGRYRNCHYLPYCTENHYHQQRETDEKCNIILPNSEVDTDSDRSEYVWVSLRDIKRYDLQVLRTIYFIAKDYAREKYGASWDDPWPGYKEKKYVHRNRENIIDSVLENLNFSYLNTKYLRNLIIDATEPNRYIFTHKGDREKKNHSIYSEGLYYTCAVERESSADMTKLYSYELFTTPEQILLNLCTKAFVVGISATAQVPSSNNFNMDYIAPVLKMRGSQYCSLDEEDLIRLIENFKLKHIGIERHQLKTLCEPVDVLTDTFLDVAKELAYLKNRNFTYDDVELIRFDKNINPQIEEFTRVCEYSDTVDSDYRRICLLWNFIRQFFEMNHRDGVVSNALVYSNKGLGTATSDIYSIDNLKLGAAIAYMGVYGCDYESSRKEVDNMFIILDAAKLKSFKDNSCDDVVKARELDHIENSFREGRPVFLITTFNSMSRGNNPQVKVGEDFIKNRIQQGELFKINDIFKGFTQMDWDAVYFEKPSYVIPNITELFKSRTHEKLKTLYAVEDICERDRISANMKKNILSDVFCSFTSGDYRLNYRSLYSANSVKRANSVIAIQTIGRISRTNVKKKYNAVFYDRELVECIEPDLLKLKQSIVTNECESFFKSIKDEQHGLWLEYEEKSHRDFSEQNRRCINAISMILDEGNNQGWNEDLIGFWEALRDMLLRHPCGILKSELNRFKKRFSRFECVKKYHFDVEDIYINFKGKKNRYFYNMKGEEVYISYDNKKNCAWCREYPFDISDQDARLDRVMDIAEVKSFFLEHGYATEWEKKSGYVMNPYIYQAIYKGALGETILKAVFTKKCGFSIEEIRNPQHYERFDFVVNVAGRKFYVDAKHISEVGLHADFANSELKKKLKQKIKDMNIEYAFVINTIDEIGDKVIEEDCGYAAVPGIFTFLKDDLCVYKKCRDNRDRLVLDEIIARMYGREV